MARDKRVFFFRLIFSSVFIFRVFSTLTGTHDLLNVCGRLLKTGGFDGLFLLQRCGFKQFTEILFPLGKYL